MREFPSQLCSQLHIAPADVFVTVATQVLEAREGSRVLPLLTRDLISLLNLDHGPESTKTPFALTEKAVV